MAENKVQNSAKTFDQLISDKVARKVKARATNESPWFGLGMMGLVGWSVVVPTLLGAGLGSWLDSRKWGNRSWTLTLLIGGLVIGCANAWHWVAAQDRQMREEGES